MVTLKANAAVSASGLPSIVIQTWDFKADRLLAQAQLPGIRRHWHRSHQTEIGVWFSGDGSSIIVLIETIIYVLSSRDLATLRTIDVANSHNPPTGGKHWWIEYLEPSPRTAALALLWRNEKSKGRIEIYDISQGSYVRGWDVFPGEVSSSRMFITIPLNYGLLLDPPNEALTWDPSKDTLFLAAPNRTPCQSGHKDPDIFAFDADSGALLDTFKSGLLIGGVAAIDGNRLLTVDADCVRTKNHHPSLRVIDESTGTTLKEVPGRGSGVRYAVSASEDAPRLLAFTGHVDLAYSFDASTRFSGYPYDRILDETFSVWDSTDFHGVVTSQNIPGLRFSSLRISSHGRYALSCCTAAFVFELP